jgi:hypothetical protein
LKNCKIISQAPTPPVFLLQKAEALFAPRGKSLNESSLQ